MTIRTIKIIKNLDVDIIHTNTRIGLISMEFLLLGSVEKKIVSHERTWTKNNWLNKLVLKIPDKIICISNSC